MPWTHPSALIAAGLPESSTGLAQAFLYLGIVQAVASVPYGTVAVTGIEFFNVKRHRVKIGWCLVNRVEPAAALAADFLNASRLVDTRATLISNVTDVAVSALETES